MRGRRILLGVAASVAVGSWAAPSSTAANGYRSFDVVYSGAGAIDSFTESQTSPQCGEVKEIRYETTHFSWVTGYHVVLQIGRSGLDGETTTAMAERSPRADNSSDVTLNDRGCQSAGGGCTGQSQPQRGTSAVLDIPAASPGGRSRFTVGAVGGFIGFVGRDFEGSWTFPTGSCAGAYDSRQLLLPEFGVPAELIAKFPVKTATLGSLPRGHYFRVLIGPGHYAASHRNSCFPSDGCYKDAFSWHGVVTVTRTS